jgi:Zn-finger nucleic acid-binding protein
MDATLSCPRCRQTLIPRGVMVEGRAVVVDICARGCGGVWLDDGDTRSGLDVSDDLLEIAPEASPAPLVDRSQPVQCPVCEVTMLRYRWNYQSPVALDQCSRGCGTWVDGGEVREMETWETQQALEEPKQAKILARVHIARLEAETAMIPDKKDLFPNPIVNALQNLYRRLL